jgi:nitrogen fixation protein NifU and related proteins
MQDLYQELIIDHGKRPRNFREMNTPTCSQEGHNPLCGDRLHLYVEHDGVIITDVSFQGDGCAISMASASLLTQVLKGKSLIQADEIFQAFHSALINGEAVESVDLGKLAALLGVSQYPTRVKCATLAWHTYIAAITSSEKPVSTE